MFPHFTLGRRMLLQQAMALAGASTATGFSVSALAKAAAREKRYLDEPTFLLLSAVADTMVPRTQTPGAIDSKVPALLDALMVNWASPERRFAFARALRAIDEAARTKTGKSFADLPPVDRNAVLKAHDAQSLRPAEKADPKHVSLMGGQASDPGYAKLKELILVLHYFSEPALTQDLTYEHAPGEWIPSVPVTPETRATGGASII